MSILSKINEHERPPAPQGWKTAFEIRDQESPGTAMPTVREQLNRGVENGIVERKKFWCPVRNQSIFHYREIGDKQV